MRQYELIFVVHPELDETALGEILERVKNWITESGNEVTKVDQWGKRRLAYPIRKQKEGHYFFFNINMSPQFSAQLERNLRFLEPIMRYLLVTKE